MPRKGKRKVIMDPQPYIDRMLENENLTDMLADPEAEQLLTWGTNQITGLLAKLSNESTAGVQANQLTTLMRKVNRLMPDRKSLSQEELVKALLELRRMYQEINPQAASSGAQGTMASLPGIPNRDAKALAVGFSQQNDSQALKLLLDWLK